MPWLAILGTIVLGALLAVLGSAGGLRVNGVPLFALGVALAFAIQWFAFVPAWRAHSERLFDLTGSLTYLTVAVLALALGNGSGRAWLVAALIAVWAVRLGTFLYRRVRAAGHDARFRSIRNDFAAFLMTWTLQGLWVAVTMGCALAVMTSERTVALDGFALAGALLWAVGFAFEVVADGQKRAFRADPSNAQAFITSGLWAWSRHPNYFGEILLWTGIAVIALPALAGTQYATLVSPVFVYVLLTRVSGIRMLEARANRRWGDDPAYVAWRDRTARLVPRPPRD
jgi:steroid 5-alpha reductase family enzyme